VRVSLKAARRYWPRLAILSVVTLGVASAVMFGSGQPAQSVRLLSGSAWLPSAKVGQLTLLDGSSAEVVAQLQVSTRGSELDVVQHGSTAYAIDRTAGTIRRIDGATYEMTQPQAPIPDAGAGLTGFAAEDAVYTIDTKRGIVATTDSRTLTRQGELDTLSTQLTPGSAAVDDAGRLWMIDNTTGELLWIDHRTRGSARNVTAPGNSVVTIANGKPVIVNAGTRQATPVDPESGEPQASFDLGVRSDDSVSVSGSPHNDRVYLVASRGALIICEITARRCGDVVPLNSGSSLGAPVEAGNRVFVPDYTAGQVWIVDLANRSVVAKSQVLDPRTQFQLVNRDGVVFFNDPQSDRAGVITLTGGVTRTAKYDPVDPAKGLTTSSPDPEKPLLPADPVPATTPTAPVTPPATNPPATNPPVSNPPPVTNPPAQPVTVPPVVPPPPPSPPPPAPPAPPPPPPPPPDQPPPPPTLKIAVSKATPMVGEDITLTVSATTNVAPRTAHWDFGDGSAGTTVMTSHRWAAAQTFQVSVQVTMPDGQQATTSVSLQVTEKPKAKLTVTAPVNGTITGQGIACPPTCTVTVDKGQVLTLTATPAANFKFTGWGGACTGTADCKVTMDGPKTVKATFTAISPTQPFAGNWTNTDPSSGDVAKLSITNPTATGATLHIFGQCTPLCDWGTTPATFSGGALHAFYQDFAKRTVVITLVNGQLIVRIHTDYTPEDGRTDRDSTDTMRKTG
jgi:hypothetical protein